MQSPSGLMTSNQQHKKRRVFLSLGLGLMTFVIVISIDIFLFNQKTHTEQLQQSQKIFQQLSTELNAFYQLEKALTPLFAIPCTDIVTRLQQSTLSSSLASVMLIDNKRVYCSSTFSSQRYEISQWFPDVQYNTPHLSLLSNSPDLGSRPLIAVWLPQITNPSKGIILQFDLQQAIQFKLQFTHPYLSHAALQIGKKAVLGGHYKIIPQANLAKTPFSTDGKLLNTPVKLHIYRHPIVAITNEYVLSFVAQALLLAILVATLSFTLSRKHFSIRNDLIQAMQRDEFSIKYQPIIQSNNLHCIGAEVLVRWQSVKYAIPPDVFIPLVEKFELIVPFTRYLMTKITQELSNHPFLPENFRININICADHLQDDQLFNDMLKLKHELPENIQLVVEMTERIAINMEEYAQQLQRLQKHAIHIALDDFGSGNSSLSYLKALHPDYIKIDKSFIAAIGTQAISSIVLDMMLGLGKKLNIAIVAEGVETEEQANFLIQHGVQFLQGFYFSRPISLTELQSWLDSKMLHLHKKTTSVMTTVNTIPLLNGEHKKAD